MKIGKKIRITYWLILLIVFLVTMVTFHFFSKEYLIHHAKKELRADARTVSQLLANVPFNKETVHRQMTERKRLKLAGKLMESRLIIFNQQHEVIDTNLRENELKKYQKKEMNYVDETLPIFSKSGEVKGYVTLITPIENLTALERVFRRTVLISLFVSFIVAALAAFVLERNLTKPIRKLQSHMNQFSIKGEFSPVSIQTKDEMGDLANSFNKLTKKIKMYDHEQKEFLQNASHELKTPLMAIQGNAEAIVDGVVEGDEVSNSLQVIINESQRLKKLVEEISDLTKLEHIEETYRFCYHPVNNVIQEMIQSMKPLADKKGILLHVKHCPALDVWMDEYRLKQAFHNLLGNCLRYAKKNVWIDCVNSGNQIHIEISDDGNGFKEGEERKVFQRFYKGENGKSGIGLAITKAIIEAHHGKIEARNNNRGGALFHIQLPKEEAYRKTRQNKMDQS
ncbi:HAMP domain-containing sensor histidine kinase [Fictibacillus sp. Mic-4]|uniref:sensor histidine kinase n=1 Tax=Fictibacillus sp. Mic-4 TaxID=3132826 RepID=UPI003CF8F8CC